MEKHPALKLIPLFAVEVAPEVTLIEPPLTVRPFDDESPAVPNPPAKVEVAVESPLRTVDVADPVPKRICWAVRDRVSKARASMPPANVDVAVEVAVIAPVVSVDAER